VVALSLTQGENTYVRPTYAGNALTKVKTTQDINFLTFRSSSFDETPVAEGNPQISEVALPTETVTHFVKEETSDSSKPDLTTARIVVSGGRGIKSKENFNLINALADAFGNAAVGASRAAVDAGYCPNEMQVGQTGKVVAPELYVAVGISGAVQHLAGMKDSKVIVAINTSKFPIIQNLMSQSSRSLTTAYRRTSSKLFPS
jgi:electron transfer flavoprotein alpha subunit